MVMIYADPQKVDYKRRLILTCYGTSRDLANNNITLKNGLNLLFYNYDEDLNGKEDNLVFEGVVEYDQENDRWLATIDWDKIKNISQLSLEEKQKLGIE